MNASPSLTTSSSTRVVGAVVLDYGSVLYVWEPVATAAGYVSADDWEEFVVDGGFLTWSGRFDRKEPFERVLVDYTRTHPGHPDWTKILSLYRQCFADSLTGPVPGMTTLLDDPLGRDVVLYRLTNFDAAPFERTGLLVPQLRCFVDIVVSGREYLAKPDAIISDFLLSHCYFQAPSILFIDDPAVNIEAVDHLGMCTHHSTGVGRLRSELIALGLLSTPDRH